MTEIGHTRQLMTKIFLEFPNFQILAGFDEHLNRVATRGGSGCIGGLSNLYPEICAAYTKAINDQDLEAIYRYQQKIDKLMDLYTYGTPFVPVIKKAMILRGVDIQDAYMKPLLPTNEEQTEKIIRLMQEVEAM